jgi:hypothetical protein
MREKLMSDSVTAADVGNVLTYVAPGFFARAAYDAVWPQADRDKFEVLVVSVATSVPLVALAHTLASRLSIVPNVTHLGYVAFLLALSVLAGYMAAVVRGPRFFRTVAGSLKLNIQPEISGYTATIMKTKGPVTVVFRDGTKLSGVPAVGPDVTQPGKGELYLVYPMWWSDEEAGWSSAGEGALVNLDDVKAITLSADPVFGSGKPDADSGGVRKQ